MAELVVDDEIEDVVVVVVFEDSVTRYTPAPRTIITMITTAITRLRATPAL